MEQGARTRKLAEQFEQLYNRHIEQEAQHKVRESMKRGQIVSIDGTEEENSLLGQSVENIQSDPILTQQQKRTRVEAEVCLQTNLLSILNS